MRAAAIRFVFMAGLLGGAGAQAQTVGLVVYPDGQPLAEDCEFYALHAVDGPATDWQAHLFAKSAAGVGLAEPDFSGGVYEVSQGNFSLAATAGSVIATFATCPDGRLQVDSGLLGSGSEFFGSAALLTVGNATDGSLTLPGTDGGWWASSYAVDLGWGPVDFPVIGTSGGSWGGGYGGGSVESQSVNYVFAPVSELNDQDRGGFTWGGAQADPGSTLPDGGFIVGYNIYRMLDIGREPTDAELGRAENWVGFAPMAFDQTIGDGPVGVGRGPAPADLDPLDLTGMQNPDALPYTGDEILIYQDAARLWDRRPNPHAPWLDASQVYAVQPVVRGTVADFAAVSIAGGPVRDHRLDLDGDGTFDAVDLDLDGSPEFFSPNEKEGFPGLGLTHAGLALLSPKALSDPTNLPAIGALTVTVEPARSGTRLRIEAAHEGADVLGYRVWRERGGQMLPASVETILAAGGTGNRYELFDRQGRARGQSWWVEVLANDGTESELRGPFTADAQGGRRR